MAACHATGVGRRTHYQWLAADQDYAERFDEATANFRDRLEQEIYRRGVLGVDKPVFYKGERVASIKEYSDVLLIFRAKAEMPHKYRDNVKVDVSVTRPHKDLSDEELETKIAAAQAQLRLRD